MTLEGTAIKSRTGEAISPGSGESKALARGEWQHKGHLGFSYGCLLPPAS